MKILLIGCGRWGQNWAKTLHSLGALGGICDARAELHGEFKEKWPGIETYSELKEALAFGSWSGCVVATPVPTHFEVAQACLNKGLGVLVEKPLTLDPVESQQLVDLAEKNNKPLAVGHVLMFHPAYVKLKKLIDEGVLGDILSVQCTRVNLGTFRNEENIWWSFAPHDVSLLMLIFGNVPLTVTGVSPLPILNRPGLEDSVYASFVTPNHQHASIHVSWYAPEKRHETVVIGTDKIAIVDDTAPWEHKLQLLSYELEMEGDTVYGVRRGTMEPVVLTEPDPPLTLEAKAFIEALKSNSDAQLPNSGRQGLAVAQALAAVEERLQKTSALPEMCGV